MRILKAIILVVAILIMLTLASQVRSQSHTDLNHIIDAAISKAKSDGIHSSRVNWDSVSIAMHHAAHGAKSVSDLKRSFEILLASLEDHDGVFYDPTTMTAIAPAGYNPDAAMHGVLKTNQSKFDYAILENNIGYLRLVAIAPGSNAQQQAGEIRQAIDSLSKGDGLQWIVDLRHTTGGDLHSLFASVAPLLDEGLVATAVDNKEKIKNMYTVHNGNFYVDQVLTIKFPLWTKDLRKARIAILTSRNTSGAAELLAIGFKGRKNTKLFGEPTAGHIFGMTNVEISKNLVMHIAHTRYVDRRGSDYKEQVQPDTMVDFVASESLADDPAIAKATLWLTSVTDSSISLGMK